MSAQRHRPASRRPRPVAELELEPLLERAGELTRRWAIALILDGPLESLGAVPLEDLARDAPELLAAVMAALGSDEGLERLLDGRSRESPAARIPALAGAGDAAAVVAAVESLRGVLSDALMDQFAGAAPEPVRVRQLTALADRLAHVCAAIVPAALEGIDGLARAPVSAPAQAAPRDARGARWPVSGGVAIIDELAPDEPPPAGPADLREEAREVGQPSVSAEIEIRDERGDEGPAAWIGSIGRRLERFEEDGVSFAVLLVEFRGEGAEQGELAGEPIEQLLNDALPAGSTMTRERAGRYWLVVPAADRLAAAGLAAELTRTLESAPGRRRPGASVAVGTAVCPEDGRRASALAAHADVGLCAARSGRILAAPLEGRPGS